MSHSHYENDDEDQAHYEEELYPERETITLSYEGSLALLDLMGQSKGGRRALRGLGVLSSESGVFAAVWALDENFIRVFINGEPSESVPAVQRREYGVGERLFNALIHIVGEYRFDPEQFVANGVGGGHSAALRRAGVELGEVLDFLDGVAEDRRA